MTREKFWKKIESEAAICCEKAYKGKIPHFVFCCWIDPFDSFQKRVGYFDDNYEAELFCNSLIETYKTFANAYVLKDGEWKLNNWENWTSINKL